MIVLNEEKLVDGGREYLKYREKVIDLELQFNPTTGEAISWGLPGGLWERQRAEACAAALDIRNVRILKKIADVIEMLKPTLDSLHDQVKEAAIRSAVLLAWCYFDKTGCAPPLDFVHSWNSMIFMLKREREKPTAEEVRWDSLIGGYRFAPFGDMDLAVEKVISQGYIEESGFAEEAAKLDLIYRNGDKEQRFTAAWDLFHNSFDNNEAELVEELREGLREGVQQITPVNLSGAAALLRQLGHGEAADELIAYYVKQRANEPGIFDLKRNPVADHMKDVPTREAFEKQMALSATTIPLRQAVEKMAKGPGWSAEDEKALSLATEDDLYRLFKGELSVRVADVVNVCLRFGNMPQSGHIAERAIAALRRIGGESAVNRIRVSRYGIDLGAGPGDADTEAAGGAGKEP